MPANAVTIPDIRFIEKAISDGLEERVDPKKANILPIIKNNAAPGG